MCQPVDAGIGYLFKKLISKAQDKWLELEDNIDIWMGNSDKILSTSQRRILIAQWVGEAFEELKSPNYDNMRKRCFEKIGCLLTADGSNDDLVQPEGLKDYKVMPPLPMPGPEVCAEFVVPEPDSEPLDIAPENDDFLFTSTDNEDLGIEPEQEEFDRIDDPADRVLTAKLVGRKIRGFYETGWHIGRLEYYNTKIQEYFVTLQDGSEDYLKEEDIDNQEVILIPENVSKVSGRVRKAVDYKKLADI